MSLYWEKENVAVEIVDDPGSEPFRRDEHPDATVLQITCEELMDPEAFGRFARALSDCLHLGTEPEENEEEVRRRHARLRDQLFGGSTW